MDAWVVSNVLQPNLQCTGFLDVSVIHTVSVENFLTQAQRFVGLYLSEVNFGYACVDVCVAIGLSIGNTLCQVINEFISDFNPRL